MTAYYNEFDPYAAAWLRNLIGAGLIAPGDVDERSIMDVQPSDLKGYTQCHFFAGIGGWSLALRMAGWADDRPVWSGSCPCQPFSAAGLQQGESDERHLWPELRRLVAECGPTVVFGEQVASRLGRGWLARVRVDLEALGYGVGATDLCAAGVDAPHIRQRLWWVADADGGGYEQRIMGVQAEAQRAASGGEQERAQGRGWDDSSAGRCYAGGVAYAGYGAGGRGVAGCDSAQDGGRRQGAGSLGRGGEDGRLAHAGRCGDERGVRPGEAAGTARPDGGEAQEQQRSGVDAGIRGSARGLGYAEHAGLQGRSDEDVPGAGRGCEGGIPSRPGGASGWRNAVWLPCADGKARRIEPGLEPLAHGVSGRVAVVRTRIEAGAEIQETHLYNRVGALRGFGNAIVPHVAAEFIRAYAGA